MHYNWHRHYDPSLGRYTQPDPLGFVDGPSVYGYARNGPYRHVDPDGRSTVVIPHPLILGPLAAGALYCYIYPDACKKLWGYCTKREGGFGGGSDDDDDCKKEWRDAYALCAEIPLSAKGLTGGYRSLADCAKGHVSERCGGNKVTHQEESRTPIQGKIKKI